MLHDHPIHRIFKSTNAFFAETCLLPPLDSMQLVRFTNYFHISKKIVSFRNNICNKCFTAPQPQYCNITITPHLNLTAPPRQKNTTQHQEKRQIWIPSLCIFVSIDFVIAGLLIVLKKSCGSPEYLSKARTWEKKLQTKNIYGYFRPGLYLTTKGPKSNKIKKQI